jgi:hypothetical protein
MKHVDQSVPSSSFSITDEATVLSGFQRGGSVGMGIAIAIVIVRVIAIAIVVQM